MTGLKRAIAAIPEKPFAATATRCGPLAGYGWVGCEHLLLALAAHDGPVGEVIRGHSITVPQIEKIIAGRARGDRGCTSFRSQLTAGA